jgi:subtilisin family serine protease
MKKTRIKKGVSVFLTTCLLLNGLGTGAFSELSISDNLRNEVISEVFDCVASEMAMFATRTIPTLDMDFKDDRVLVVLRQSHSEVNATHEVREFNNFVSATYVEYNNVQSVERSFSLSMFSMIEDLMYVEDFSRNNEVFDNTDFRQILSLELRKPSKENVLKAIEILEQHESVLFAQPCYIHEIIVPSVSDYDEITDFFPLSILSQSQDRTSEQWALRNIRAQEAWGISGTTSVRVGIFEHRFEYSHEDLFDNVPTDCKYGNFPVDSYGYPVFPSDVHATRVAGIIGAVHNDFGINGVAKNVELIPLTLGDGSSSALAASIRWASEEDIRIINASWVFKTIAPPTDTVLEAAIRNFHGLFVASAGNMLLDNDITPIFPANYKLSNVISVGATDRYDRLSLDWTPSEPGSHFGVNSVHLFAPGGQGDDDMNSYTRVLTTSAADRYRAMGGTSAAAPHVSGVAALIWSTYPNATPQQVKWAILEGVDRIPALEGLCVTGGRLNAYGALRAMERVADMVYGVHHIRSVLRHDFYLDMPSQVNNSFLAIRDPKPWVVQRIPSATPQQYEIRSTLPINNNIARIRMPNNNQSVEPRVSTDATFADMTVHRYSDGSVTFSRVINGNRFALAIVLPGRGVGWESYNGANNQRWFLEPQRLTYQRGDVNHDGRVDARDIEMIASYVQGTATPTAIQFFLADTTRTGIIGGCSGGVIAPPTPSANWASFINGNSSSWAGRGNIEVNVSNLIAGTHIKANDIYGFEAVTWGPNTENRQAYFRVNDSIQSPLFHASSSPHSARLWSIMEHGNTPDNGGRTQAQTMRYMNMYSNGSANNIIPLTPFVSSASSNLSVVIRPNDNHASLVTSISLLGRHGQMLGVALYSTRNDNGTWIFMCLCH